jgi:hypothetical protein
MLLPKQTNDIPQLIDDQRKQTRNITAQHAYVQRFWFDDRSKLTAKYHCASSCLTSEAKLRFDDDRRGHTAKTTKALLGGTVLEIEGCEESGTEYRAISGCIHQKLGCYPAIVAS